MGKKLQGKEIESAKQTRETRNKHQGRPGDRDLRNSWLVKIRAGGALRRKSEGLASLSSFAEVGGAQVKGVSAGQDIRPSLGELAAGAGKTSGAKAGKCGVTCVCFILSGPIILAPCTAA